jgi:predicted metal-binding membrane protein
MVLAAAVVAGWVALVLAQVSGHEGLVHLDHQVEPGHHGGGGAWPLGPALVAFAAAWALMVVAMMLPSALPMIGLHASAAAVHDRRAAARAAFLAGYGTVWTAAGVVALGGAAALHGVVGSSPWLAERPRVVAGALLATAGAAQFLPLTQACLRACRHPYAFLLTRFRPGVAAAFRLGRDHGLYCLGCCWALMLVMFAAGVADLWWMAGLTAVMVYEKVGRRGTQLATVVGVVLVAAGGVVLLAGTGGA